MVFTFHEDPGHGWLEVQMSYLKELGVEPSRYSYMSRNMVYLEEDSDMPKFVQAYMDKIGDVEIRTIYYDNRCFIRDLRPYHKRL